MFGDEKCVDGAIFCINREQNRQTLVALFISSLFSSLSHSVWKSIQFLNNLFVLFFNKIVNVIIRKIRTNYKYNSHISHHCWDNTTLYSSKDVLRFRRILRQRYPHLIMVGIFVYLKKCAEKVNYSHSRFLVQEVVAII